MAVSGCGGGESQDANEPEGTYRLEVADASFPAEQGIAEADHDAHPRAQPGAAHRPERRRDGRDQGRQGRRRRHRVRAEVRRLAPRRPSRPIWILDQEPVGGTSAYANTWTLGPLKGGETKTFEWKLTAVEPGSYSLAYRVAPGLDGKAALAAGSKARGTFAVRVVDEPVPARVNSKGEVVRGEEAGAGKD